MKKLTKGKKALVLVALVALVYNIIYVIFEGNPFKCGDDVNFWEGLAVVTTFFLMIGLLFIFISYVVENWNKY